MKILFATTNQGKIKEVESILRNLGITAISPKDIPGSPEDVEETGTTFEENACIKATAYGQVSGLITLADDTGLEVDALDGRPGVYSARYAPTDADKIKKIIKELKNTPEAKRSAQFVSVICIYDPKTKKTQTAKGVLKGKITHVPKGTNGFGYDPIFYSPELGKTLGEATFAEKNKISHRARALAKTKKVLRNLISS